MNPAWPETIDCGQPGAHLKMAEKRAPQKVKPDRVFGQGQKRSKMFRAGLYARVSTHDQKTLPMQYRANARVCLPPRLDHCPASPRGELRGSAERSPRETDRGRTLCRIRPLASHGTPYRYRNRAQCCAKRRHDQSGNQQRGRRRVLEYQGVFSTSSASCYRNIRVSATPDIVLQLMAQCPWRRPYQ
jgi:hypothetical protein